MIYLTLFIISFGAATFLPIPSELFFAYAITDKNLVFGLVLFSASLGNTLGSFVNYGIGRFAINFALRKKYVKKESLDKAHLIMEKYGYWALLLTWAPVIGGPIMLISGALKLSWWKFLIVVAIAKTLRYGVLAYGILYIF